MDIVTPPLAVETEALRKAYAAFNRNDIAATDHHESEPSLLWRRQRLLRKVKAVGHAVGLRDALVHGR